MSIREQLRIRAPEIVAAFDAHDPGVLTDGTHLCPCGWTGDKAHWELHLVDNLADVLTETVLELPGIGAA